jgi:hypothetical protein
MPDAERVTGLPAQTVPGFAETTSPSVLPLMAIPMVRLLLQPALMPVTV